MSKNYHKLFVFTLIGIVVLTFIYLIYTGTPYYRTDLEERFFHPDHASLKPSGPLGHGLGIIGTLLMMFGVFSYMLRNEIS